MQRERGERVGRGGGGGSSDTPFSVQTVKEDSVQVITNFPVEAMPMDIILCGPACKKVDANVNFEENI